VGALSVAFHQHAPGFREPNEPGENHGGDAHLRERAGEIPKSDKPTAQQTLDPAAGRLSCAMGWIRIDQGKNRK
jgi:hypothetical protein